jgi:hypothetical protein
VATAQLTGEGKRGFHPPYGSLVPTPGCKADRARTDGALGVRSQSRPPRGGGSGAVSFALGKSDGEGASGAP